MKKILLCAGFISVLLASLPAGAWVVAGRNGVVVAPPRPAAVYVAPRPVYVAPNAGYARGVNGGSAAWNHGAGVAYGARGGSAAWNNGAGGATGPRGGTAAWHR